MQIPHLRHIVAGGDARWLRVDAAQLPHIVFHQLQTKSFEQA